MPTVLVVEHAADAGLDLMATRLGAGATVEVVRPYLGESVPETVGGHDALVVLGGEMGAYDDERAPWLPATRALIMDGVRSAVPVLGICLGAQLLAAATGGRVERGEPGLEIGVVEVSPLEAGDPFIASVAAVMGPGAWPVAQYHYDAVTELPPGAELLVTGDRYPVQAFRVGANAYGVQFHPEVSAAGFEAWVRMGKANGELADDVQAAVPARQELLADALADSLIKIVATSPTADRRSGSGDTVSR